MDEDPLRLNQSPQSIDRSYRQLDRHEAQCLLCRRLFSPGTELNEAFEAIPICRGCKLSVLDDSDTGATMRNLIRRRRFGGRNRLGSSESMEDMFSHQFSQLISLVRQNHEALIDSDSTSILHNHTSHTASRSRSRRWWRTFSDNDSDSVDYVDSLFGESESILSFGGYGGESDTSVDGRSVNDREILVPLDNENHFYTDSDIDPMHAGLDQWNSDNEEDDDGEWEEADVDGAPRSESHASILDATSSPISGNRGVHDGTVIGWMLGGHQPRYYSDFFSDLERSEIPPYLGNTGPYLDARGFEEILEQLAENDDGSRRGAPPASTRFVESLPCVIITKDHEKNGSLICPVCKDPLPIYADAKQLPCMHLYHSNCILPWLSTRNSCPVCRYELPTDDPEYEECKQRMHRSIHHEIQHQHQADESSSEISTDMEADEAMQANADASDNLADSPNRPGGGRGRWLFLAAAAPIVSMVGIVVVLWLRNSLGNSSIRHNHRSGDPQQIQNSRSISSPTNRSNRRWWSLF